MAVDVVAIEEREIHLWCSAWLEWEMEVVNGVTRRQRAKRLSILLDRSGVEDGTNG